MRPDPKQADFDREQRINAAYRDYQAGKIDSAECLRRVKEAERG